MRSGAAILLILAFLGCSRQYYRHDADRETYAAIDERNHCPPWAVPQTSIDPPPASRLYDPFDADCPPMPPDDFAAHVYMHCVDGKRGDPDWHKQGDAPWIESPIWLDFLQLSPENKLVLTSERAVELGILHSREYQSELENLYLTALALTLNRYEFAVQWFGRNNSTYTHFGTSSLPVESNTLANSSNLGFSRAFASGGQMLVDFANTWVWEFTGPDSNTVSSSIAVDFIQPILRGAGREIRLEGLTQAERDLLYAIRDFARFRKFFYADVTTRGGSFLTLLLQRQAIRNLESNLESLEQNLRLHEALFKTEEVSRNQVDQVFQSVQQGRLSLLQAETRFQTALDSYKTQLGLPPSIETQLDDSLLDQFQLNDPAVLKLQGEVGDYYRSVLNVYLLPENELPPVEQLRKSYDVLEQFRARTAQSINQLDSELKKWESILQKRRASPAQLEVERQTFDSITKLFSFVVQELQDMGRDIQTDLDGLDEMPPKDAWEILDRRASKLENHAADLFVLQTQIRVHFIELPPVGYEEREAIGFALDNRLDLMNQRAQVVDAWRGITVAADRLESDLDVVVGADIRTEADASRPFDFSASNSSYSVGLRVDGPLNRRAERNIYRRSLIEYQRARRAYMAQADGIAQAIRRDLRNIQNERLNFDIARQTLVSAARQVDFTRLQLKDRPPSDSSGTQDILDALNSLLRARNNLIGSWVNYEANRIQLLLDLEALQLDERGIILDESNNNLTEEQTDATRPSGQENGPS